MGPHPPNNQGKTLTHRGWTITTTKLPILNSSEIDAMTRTLGLTPPEMIFGHNGVSVSHAASGWAMRFTALEALRGVDTTGSGRLQVSYSESWKRMRERVHTEIKEVVKPFDWTYTTDFKGSVSTTTSETASAFAPTADLIPFDRLKLPEPILLFDEVVLYEDELADNGISLLSVKIRVMPERLFILSRFFLRLDGVLFRVRDTRVYIDLATGEVIREYQAREESYARVRSGMHGRTLEEIPSLMRDPQVVSELTPVVETVREKAMVLGPTATATATATCTPAIA